MSTMIDIFEGQSLSVIEESKGEVDGKHVIGKVKGEFFFPDGKSRNKRFYPKQLWEKAISSSEVKTKLAERRMLGTISHDQPISDIAALEGKLSHIVTNLEITPEGKGIGEALILDTKAGKALNTLFRAGVKLFVSSRAIGKLEGKEQGIDRVDPDTYKLETFDFVLDPGFLAANPTLVESLKAITEDQEEDKKIKEYIDNKINTIDEKIKTQGEEMSKELLESVMSEKTKLEIDLGKALNEADRLKNENIHLSSTNKSLEGQLRRKDMSETLLNEYKTLGTPSEIERAFSKSRDIKGENKRILENLGTYDEINEALDKAAHALKEYKELGTPSDLDKVLDESKRIIEDLGSYDQIDNALEKATDIIKEYKELGTPEEINRAFDLVLEQADKMKDKEKESEIAQLSKELGVEEEKIAKLYAKLSKNEIKDIFKDMKSKSKVVETYSKGDSYLNIVNKEEENNDMPFRANLGSRLMESFGGYNS